MVVDAHSGAALDHACFQPGKQLRIGLQSYYRTARTQSWDLQRIRLPRLDALDCKKVRKRLTKALQADPLQQGGKPPILPQNSEPGIYPHCHQLHCPALHCMLEGRMGLLAMFEHGG